MSDPSKALLIGVDGGGSGCRVAIGTAAAGIIARGEGGRANISSDPEQAINNVRLALKAAAATAAIDETTLAGATVHLGLAGVMCEADSEKTARAFAFQNITVSDDRATALAGALGGEDGFLLCIGTGTIVAASKRGAQSFIGGWGLQVSDQSSGAWLGRAVLEQVLLCHDRIARHSDLTRKVFGQFQNDPNKIVAMSLAAKPADYAGLAPHVISAATAGDPIGRMLMAQGASYLTRGLDALAFQAGDVLCFAGGIGPHYGPYLTSEMLAGQIEARGTALDGAFHMAKAQLSKALHQS